MVMEQELVLVRCRINHILFYNFFFYFSGDSGGSMFIKDNGQYKAVGIISKSLIRANGICDVNKPQIYTDVSAYYDWIVETVTGSVAPI